MPEATPAAEVVEFKRRDGTVGRIKRKPKAPKAVAAPAETPPQKAQEGAGATKAPPAASGEGEGVSGALVAVLAGVVLAGAAFVAWAVLRRGGSSGAGGAAPEAGAEAGDDFTAFH